MDEIAPSEADIQEALSPILARLDEFELFRRQVVDFFLTSRHFYKPPLPLVHSVKSRIKDADHIKDKIRRYAYPVGSRSVIFS